MNKKNKIVLLVPDGVGIKNYLYSNVFDNSDFEFILMHNFDEKTIAVIQSEINVSVFETLPNYVESISEKFLRELICLLRLNYNAKKVSNKTILTNWKKKHQNFKNVLFYRTIELVSLFFKKYSTILVLEKRYQQEIRKSNYYKQITEILKTAQPTKIVCTHQRAVQAAPFFAAANDLNIETSTFIFSWDNLPKARLALRATSYFVWSEYMKSEMVMYYPEIDINSVIVTGTPQFQFYNDIQNIIEKEFFFDKYNLDFSKKIICFSGDDTLTSPFDAAYLEDIASEIVSSKLDDKFQIVFRPCPVDFSNRYDEVLNKFPDIIKIIKPDWIVNNNRFAGVFPNKSDIQLLVSTCFYSDIVVNIGSTMAFDFAQFNKPCVYINYNQNKKSKWSVETIYNFQHFRSLPNYSAVYWLNSKKNISNIIVNAIQNGCTSEMHSWENIILGNNIDSKFRIQNQLRL